MIYAEVFIKSEVLSDDDMDEAVGAMMAATPLIDKWSRHYTGDRHIKEFRLMYVAGKCEDIPEDDACLINNLSSISNKLVKSIAAMLAAIARRFVNHRLRPLYDFDDYFQEACSAAADVVWYYDGSTKYITLATTAAKNRLVDVARTKCLDTIQDSVLTEIEDHWSMETIILDHYDDEIDHEYDMDVFWKAMKTAPLSELERDVMVAFLEDIPGFQTAVAKMYEVSKTTGNNAWIRACKKVRDTYQSLCQCGQRMAA